MDENKDDPSSKLEEENSFKLAETQLSNKQHLLLV